MRAKWRKTKEWAAGADVLFWLLLAAFVPAVLVAASTDARTPAWALHSDWLHRTEVGLAVFFVGYLLALALRLAYQGRPLGRVALPGGGELDPNEPALDQAAEGLEEFQQETRASFKEHDESLKSLDERLTRLEDGRA